MEGFTFMKLKDRLLEFILNPKYLGIILLIFFIAIRLPYLGFSNFNTDSFKWKARIYDFGSGVFNLNFEQTVQKYHPGVTLLWVGTFSVKAYNFIYESILNTPPLENTPEFLFSLNFYQIFFVVLFIGFLYLKTFKYLSLIISPLKSFVILLIVSLEPFFMGLSTTLHLDGILNVLLLNTVLVFYLYLTTSVRKYLYLTSFYLGLALLTKTTAFLILPFLFISYVVFKYKESRIYTHVLNLLSLISLTFLVYFVFWPGMWVDPINTLIYIFKGVTVGTDDHSQIYFGNLVSDPGPFYYLIVSFIKTPIYIFPIVLLALGRQLNTTYKKYIFEYYLILGSILYLIEISIPSKKLDRYILTSLIFLSIALLSFLYDKYKKITISLLILNLATVFYLRFDFFSYYNPLAGGLSAGINMVEPKWVFGQKEIVDFFSDEIKIKNKDVFSEGNDINKISKENNNLVVALPEKYYTQLYPYFRLIGAWAVINEIKPQAQKASYFMFPVWEDNSIEFISRYNLRYYKDIDVRGVSVFKVYIKE